MYHIHLVLMCVAIANFSVGLKTKATHVLLVVRLIELNETSVHVFGTSRIPAETPKHPAASCSKVDGTFNIIVSLCRWNPEILSSFRAPRSFSR